MAKNLEWLKDRDIDLLEVFIIYPLAFTALFHMVRFTGEEVYKAGVETYRSLEPELTNLAQGILNTISNITQ
jgi:hypothetical protein